MKTTTLSKILQYIMLCIAIIGFILIAALTVWTLITLDYKQDLINSICRAFVLCVTIGSFLLLSIVMIKDFIEDIKQL